MAPIGSPNLLPDAPVMKDLNNNLKIEQISTSDNFPTILDENSLAGTSPIYCFCDSYNSEFYRGSN